MDYQEINSETIDRWVDEGWEWGKPISHKEYLKAKKGEWEILLTPTKPVPKTWFPPICGKRVLGLAAGGGQQMPIFAALGAECYVLDYSKRQIESEEIVANREGYKIKAVRADMTKPLPYEDGFFDLIVHPVSNCYVEEVLPIWKECFRVLKPNGILLSGLDNGINYLFEEDDESKIVNRLPYNPLKDETQMKSLLEGDYGVQFSHTMEEQIGGQIKAGFTLLDVYEDTNGEGFLKERGVPTFWVTKSIKKV